jgi:molybdopterin/thiamine biosynthesis adenylyltransferase
MSKQHRFKDASWLPIAQSLNVTVGGAGGIGSIVAFLLSRIEPKTIYLYDDDYVNEANLSNQLFSYDSLGLLKVEVVKNICNNFSKYNITDINSKFTNLNLGTEVMISCFDNMEARKEMFEVYVNNIEHYLNLGIKPLFIDGRLTAEQFYIYTVTPDKIEEYEKNLFPSSEAAVLPCGFKGTTHNSFMIGSKIVALFTNYCYNIAVKEDLRDLPFCIENDIFTMTEIIKI